MSTGSNHPTTSTDHFTLRDEFILQHAEHKNIKQVAQEYFNAFDFSAKGAALDALRASLNATNNNHLAESMKEDDFKKWATRYFALAKEKKKLSIQNIVEKERNKLQITGVLKGSNLIKAGMDLLAPEIIFNHVGQRTEVFAMSLRYEACYLVVDIGEFDLVVSRYQFGNMITAARPLLAAWKIAMETQRNLSAMHIALITPVNTELRQGTYHTTPCKVPAK